MWSYRDKIFTASLKKVGSRQTPDLRIKLEREKWGKYFAFCAKVIEPQGFEAPLPIQQKEVAQTLAPPPCPPVPRSEVGPALCLQREMFDNSGCPSNCSLQSTNSPLSAELQAWGEVIS